MPLTSSHGLSIPLPTSSFFPASSSFRRAKPKRGYHIFWPFNPDPVEPFVNPPPIAPRSRRTSVAKGGKSQVDYVQGALKEDMMSELEVRPGSTAAAPRLPAACLPITCIHLLSKCSYLCLLQAVAQRVREERQDEELKEAEFELLLKDALPHVHAKVCHQ